MISIAIVEDIDEIRQALHDFIVLKPEFYVAGIFKTAEGAVLEIPFLQPDIVIMDINLPGISGIECIRQLKHKISSVSLWSLADNNNTWLNQSGRMNAPLLFDPQLQHKLAYTGIVDPLDKNYGAGGRARAALN